MSLSVHAYFRTVDGEMSFIEPPDPSQDLAGFESYRKTLYGSRAAVSLGLKILPKLANGDICVEGEELEQLRSDVELAFFNVALFVTEAGARTEDLRPRFENILNAIRRAQEAGGGVVIW